MNKKIICIGIVSMLILTVVLTMPTIGARNVTATEDTEASYDNMLSTLPGPDDASDYIISLFDYISTDDVIQDAFGDLISDMDRLFHPDDYSQADAFEAIREAAMRDMKSNVRDIKSTGTDNACRKAFDSVDDVKDRSDLPEDWQNTYDDVMDHVNSKSSLKNLLNTAKDALGLDDYAKLVLWFIWVISFAGIAAVPGSIAAIGLVEAAAVALVTALVLADGIGNVAAMENLFPLGKLTAAQRTAIATLVISVIAFGAYVMLGPVVHSVVLMLGGIIAVNVLVDEIVKEFDISDDSSDPVPVNTGPVMSLMRLLIQWYMVERNPNAFPILRYLFGNDSSQ